MEYGGIAIDEFRGELRVDGWAQFDRLGLLSQLGVINPGGAFS